MNSILKYIYFLNLPDFKVEFGFLEVLDFYFKFLFFTVFKGKTQNKGLPLTKNLFHIPLIVGLE